MNKTGNIYINLEEFQKFILDYIQSDEFDKAFESTIFYNDTAKSELCFQAMEHGLIWASLLAGQLPKLIHIEEEKNNMKYIQTKFCKGTFILEKHINLDNFLNEDEQKRFYDLKNTDENKMSGEDFKWYEDVLNRIKEESDFVESEVVSYEVDDWEEYDDENWII